MGNLVSPEIVLTDVFLEARVLRRFFEVVAPQRVRNTDPDRPDGKPHRVCSGATFDFKRPSIRSRVEQVCTNTE